MRALIAVEDITYGETIADFIINHEWPTNIEFKILHVVDLGLLTHPSDIAYGELLDNYIADSWSQGRSLVSKIAQKIRNTLPDVQVEEEVVEGSAKEKILDMARQWKANIIFVGSHGRKGFDRFLMGSVSSAVVSHAPCTVMVVRLQKSATEPNPNQQAILEEAKQ